MNAREEAILVVVQNVMQQRGGDPARVTPEALLREDLGIDSLGAVELVFAFEEEFKISIDMTHFRAKTVGEAIAFVAVLLPAQPDVDLPSTVAAD